MLFCGKIATSAKKGYRDLSIVENHQQLNSTACSSSTSHQAGSSCRKGRSRRWSLRGWRKEGERAECRGKKKIRAAKNQAQKGCGREEARSRNARQKGLFRK